MNPATSNLHPILDRAVPRSEKEGLTGQRGHVVWLYGLSGSGKSTLSLALERRLHAEGRLVALLDGDNLRTGLNRSLGWSEADRLENIRRAAEVAKLFVHNGVVAIGSFITPLQAQRETLRAVIGGDDLTEVYVKASFEACARRDVKGLYAKAAAGGLAQLPGRDFAWDEPTRADLVLDTEAADVAVCLETLAAALAPKLRRA